MAAGHRAPADRRQPVLPAGGIPQTRAGRAAHRQPAGGRHRADAVVRLFDARPLPQPRGTAPRRRRSLRRADLRLAGCPPLHPSLLLHLRRRPHRPRHRRHPRPQGACRRGGAAALRRHRFVETFRMVREAAPRRRNRGARLRAAAVPVVLAARQPAQPLQDRRHRRPHGIRGRHQHRRTLPRRRRAGTLARRTPAHRGRSRRRPATALRGRLGAGRRRTVVGGTLRGRAGGRSALLSASNRMDARRPFAHDADRSLRAAHRGGTAHAAHLVALFPAAARALRSVAARRAARVPRAGGGSPAVPRTPIWANCSVRESRSSASAADFSTPNGSSPTSASPRSARPTSTTEVWNTTPRRRRCCSIPRRCGRRSGASTKTSPRALRSIPKRGGAARCTTGWATASHGSSHRCCNKRRLA